MNEANKNGKASVFEQVNQQSAAEAVTSQIEELILTGVYGPGERLPGEREMAKKFDLSRPTLRLALKDLEQRGLVRTQHGGGTFVSDIVGSIFSDSMINILRSNKRATEDYLEFRRSIESFTCALAAQRATEADKEILGLIFQKMEKTYYNDDFVGEAEVDVEFHIAIGETAHNVILLHTLKSFYKLLKSDIFFSRSVLYNLPGARDRLFEQHRAIYQAIISGQDRQAAEAAEKHMHYVADALRDSARVSSRRSTSERRLEKLRGIVSRNDEAADDNENDSVTP
jgi:GntR family transcriptional repressor for pyruvate dehydrogenase complex